MNCATTNNKRRVICKRVRGAMNCATTNKEARDLQACKRRNELRDYKQKAREVCKRRNELRDYKQQEASV